MGRDTMSERDAVINEFVNGVTVCKVGMSKERIEMLKKALALYEFAVDQRKEYDESNEFFCMVEELSKIVGADLHS